MNKYEVELKSTTYRTVEVEAIAPEDAVDEAVEILTNDPEVSNTWIANAEESNIVLLDMGLVKLYGWLEEASGTIFESYLSVDYIQRDDNSISVIDWEDTEVLVVDESCKICLTSDSSGPLVKIEKEGETYTLARLFRETK